MYIIHISSLVWRKIIQGKFGEVIRGWNTCKVRETVGMCLWRDIRKGWEDFSHRITHWVKNGIQILVGWEGDLPEGSLSLIVQFSSSQECYCC